MFCKQNAWLAEVPDKWVLLPHTLTGLAVLALQVPRYGKIRGDEIFMFVSSLRWVLIRLGQKTDVTFAQEKEAIIANVTEEAQRFGRPWELA